MIIMEMMLTMQIILREIRSINSIFKYITKIKGSDFHIVAGATMNGLTKGFITYSSSAQLQSLLTSSGITLPNPSSTAS